MTTQSQRKIRAQRPQASPPLPQPDPQEIDVNALAASLLRQYGTTQAATEAMVAQAQTSPGLMSALTADLRLIVGPIVARASAYSRNTTFQAYKTAKAAAPPNTRGWAQAVEKSLLDGFRLHNGKTLREGHADDLAATVANYRSQSADMTLKADWLDLIIGRLKPGKTVGQSMAEKDVAALLEDAA